MFTQAIINTAERILREPEYAIPFDKACELAVLSASHPVDFIACAHQIRVHHLKKRVFTCAIINARSGFCSEDCAFCAQSSHHATRIETYPLMSEELLLANAIRMEKAGATRYSIVTSGYALTPEETDRVCRAAAAIRSKTNLRVCASLGMLTESRARQLRESGVSRYHHNLETARSYFDRICTTHDYEEDLETVRIAGSAGLEVCSGGILGLGETWEQRVELVFTLRELDVDCIPLNFLNPVPGTRMEGRPCLPSMEALRCIALFRFIHPRKNITVCGGREVTLGDFQSWIFMAGANGLMIGDYLTTKGRSTQMDMEMIAAMGLENGSH